MSPKPIAVLISDIHFSLATLEQASEALRQAKYKAYDLEVPLVLAGDTLDGKALIRGECANRLIEIFKEEEQAPHTLILVGNHDKINEKGEDHALNFLTPYCTVIKDPVFQESIDSWLLPYFSDSFKLRDILEQIPGGSRIIMHQGVQTAYMGHYVQDTSSLPKEAFKDYRVISGHYHRRQDIKCGPPRKGAVGLFSYIGNPYSLSFSEAEDGSKGFQILKEDGTLTFVTSNIQQHVIEELSFEAYKHYLAEGHEYLNFPNNSVVWIKLRGLKSEISSITKKDMSRIIGRMNFKMDKIYTDEAQNKPLVKNASDAEIIDGLIDQTNESKDNKEALKALWRTLR